MKHIANLHQINSYLSNLGTSVNGYYTIPFNGTVTKIGIVVAYTDKEYSPFRLNGKNITINGKTGIYEAEDVAITSIEVPDNVPFIMDYFISD